MKKNNKIRVNISVDRELLKRAKTRLNLFGGKISTLFNAYLAEFVDGINKNFDNDKKEFKIRLNELDRRIEKLENRRKSL